MNGFINTTYLIAYITANLVALLLLVTAILRPKLSRLGFVLLFAWAAGVNFLTVFSTPNVYLEYSTMSFTFYHNFIQGWFAANIVPVVTLIAIGQVLIALGMLLNGWWVKLACIGAILFFLGITPLWMGSAFPFSLIGIIAVIVIWAKDDMNFLWKFQHPAHSAASSAVPE